MRPKFDMRIAFASFVCLFSVVTSNKIIHLGHGWMLSCAIFIPFPSRLAQLNEDEPTYINGVVYIYLFVLH